MYQIWLIDQAANYHERGAGSEHLSTPGLVGQPLKRVL
jgi:hypothetical protein